MSAEQSLDQLRRGDAAPSGSAAAVPAPPRRWATRVVLPAAIIMGALALLLYAGRDMLTRARPVDVVPVVVKAVSGAQAAATGGVVTQAPGWIEPDPYAISVAVQADGVVATVEVLEGEAVEAGDVIATLIDEDARLALAKANATVLQRLAELNTALLAAGSSSGEAAAASALAELREQLKRLPAQIAVEQATLEKMQRELDAKREVAARGVVSQTAVELIEPRVRAQQAVVKSIEQQVPILEARLKYMAADLGAKVEIARSVLKVAEAARDEADLRLARMTVRSPVDGVVMQRQVEPGSFVNAANAANASVARLYNPSRLQVRVDVPLADAAKVGVGHRAEVSVEMLPDDVFTGKVTRVVHEADILRNTLQFKVAIDDPSPKLKPEMLARVRFIGVAPQDDGAVKSGGRQRVFAPAKLVGDEAGAAATVWIADQARNVAVKRSVTLGTVRQGGWIEVSTGLNPGDRLILSPPPDLREGERLAIRDAAVATNATIDKESINGND